MLRRGGANVAQKVPDEAMTATLTALNSHNKTDATPHTQSTPTRLQRPQIIAANYDGRRAGPKQDSGQIGMAACWPKRDVNDSGLSWPTSAT